MTDESKTPVYPFETDHLRKGDVIDTETIERAYGVSRKSESFGLVLLRAKDFVIRRFADRGEIVTIRSRKQTLIIETDTTQSPYNRGRYVSGIRGARRSHRRMLGADRSQIADPDVLASHDRALEVQGRQLSALRREALLSPAKAEERKTPRALPPADEVPDAPVRPTGRSTPGKRR